jgi:hypothetical protein
MMQKSNRTKVPANWTEDEIATIAELSDCLIAFIDCYREEYDCSETCALEAVEVVLGNLLAKAIHNHGPLDWYLSVLFNRFHANMQYQHTGEHPEKARGPVMSFVEYCAAWKRVMTRHGITDMATGDDAYTPGLWNEICEEHAAIVGQGAA